MGYPMTYRRVVARNGLGGDYDFTSTARDDPRDGLRNVIAGDMRRLERDSRDPRHLDAYARTTGLTPDQVKAVLDAFFEASFIDLDWVRFPREDAPPFGNDSP